MKKLLFTLVAFYALSSFKAPIPPEETLEKQFNERYPEAREAKWFVKDNLYQVSFKQDDISVIIYFNKKNGVDRSLRYYEERDLNPFIACKIKENYKNKMIKGIAELTTGYGIKYEIVMEDNASIYIIHSDSAGNMETVNKYKKA